MNGSNTKSLIFPEKKTAMKRNVLLFGLIIGGILTASMIYFTVRCYNNPEFETNDTIGYTTLVVIFSLIFVGIKSYRDKHNGGIIRFGEAFRVGLYISLIASTMYVGVWLVEYYVFMPDFLDSYAAHVMHQVSLDGAPQSELDAKAAELESYKELYANPVFVVLISYAEVLPIGIVVSLTSALILKKRR